MEVGKKLPGFTASRSSEEGMYWVQKNTPQLQKTVLVHGIVEAKDGCRLYTRSYKGCYGHTGQEVKEKNE